MCCKSKNKLIKRSVPSLFRFNFLANLRPNATSGIRCPEVKSYSEQGEIFLLRCDSKEQLLPENDCDDVVAVQCNEGIP